MPVEGHPRASSYGVIYEQLVTKPKVQVPSPKPLGPKSTHLRSQSCKQEWYPAD